MDASCLAHVLTDDERQQFDRDGFFVVDDALSPAMVEELTTAADRIDAETRARDGLSSR